jgi:bacterioferritin
MAKRHIATQLNITREEMVELLNDDLAREFQAIMAYTSLELDKHASEELGHALKIVKQINDLGGTPSMGAGPHKLPGDKVEVLRRDLEDKREAVAHYRRRICQAEAMHEAALNETLREIVEEEQAHEMDLCDALGIEPSNPTHPPESES